MRQSVSVLLVALYSAASFAADCSDNPANFMSSSNCGFDTDILGWTSWQGTGAHSAMGFPEPGSFRSTANMDGFPDLFVEADCFSVAPSIDVIFGGYFRLVDAQPNPVECKVALSTYFLPSCSFTTGVLESPWVEVDETNWTVVDATISTPGNAASASFTFECRFVDPHAGDPFDVLFDDAFAEDQTVPVELQEFSVE